MSTENPLDENAGELTAADRELEAALGSLLASPAAASRDALLFEAGRRAGRRPLVFWRAAAGALAACVVAAFLLPAREPRTGGVVIVDPPKAVIEPTPTRPERRPAAEQFAYLELRNLVLTDGVDALPRSPHGGDGDAMVPTLNPLSKLNP